MAAGRMRRLRPFAAALLVTAPRFSRGLSSRRATASPDPWVRITEKRKERRSLEAIAMPELDDFLAAEGIPAPRRVLPELLQVNVGLTCNLACSHCHVESSPSRRETMDARTAERILELLARSPSIRTVDITGGAPEMHAAFATIVRGARELGLRVIDRCNLTVLKSKGMEHMAQFLADEKVDIVASLPCYTSANVEKQRGTGVFLDSIDALQTLNGLGYGSGADGAPRLSLVYNPGGAFLPPDQRSLEATYRDKLKEDFDIVFDELFCMTNMPIKRFADELREAGELQRYMELLVTNFNVNNVENVMCKSMVHVAYDGP